MNMTRNEHHNMHPTCRVHGLQDRGGRQQGRPALPLGRRHALQELPRHRRCAKVQGQEPQRSTQTGLRQGLRRVRQNLRTWHDPPQCPPRPEVLQLIHRIAVQAPPEPLRETHTWLHGHARLRQSIGTYYLRGVASGRNQIQGAQVGQRDERS